MVLPTYTYDLNRVWPEVPHRVQTTSDASRGLAAMTLTLAYVAGGGWFRGSLAEDLTVEKYYAELKQFLLEEAVPEQRVLEWAKSILIDPLDTMTAEELDEYVPKTMPEVGIALHGYQRRVAAWAAKRMGWIAALSCGTGKTVTAWAATEAARRMGRCSSNRCYIVCPKNAIGTWKPYARSFEKNFDEVAVLSVDSAHRYQNVSDEGGAIIFDEVHRCKNVEARRTRAAFGMRKRFDFCSCLTGTFLHTGPDGVVAIQDLAVPGLSRVTNLWNFGEMFNCIATKKVGRRQRRSIVIPPESHFDAFVRYLNRGVISLSFASAEVREAVKLPGQTQHLIDTFPKPEWVRELEQNEDLEVFWIPDIEDDNEAFAYVALAIQTELMEMAEAGELFTKDGEKIEVDDVGLPHFSLVFTEACREGRYDRVPVRRINADGSAQLLWVYAPGSDRKNPAPGPKLTELGLWLDLNADEPALLGAASTGAKEMIIRLLEERKRDYRLIDGHTPTKKRQGFVDEFQDGKVDYMVVQQKAGSESITLTRSSYTHLVDHSWSPIDYSQYLARTCRTGQDRECDHFDYAFTGIQAAMIARLIRGERFDTQVRAELERIVNEYREGINA